MFKKKEKCLLEVQQRGNAANIKMSPNDAIFGPTDVESC